MIKIIIHCRTLTWNLILIYLLFYVTVEKNRTFKILVWEKCRNCFKIFFIWRLFPFCLFKLLWKVLCNRSNCHSHYKKNYDFFSQFFFIGVKYITESFNPPKPLQHLKVPFQWPAHIYITWLMLMGFSGPKCRFIIKQTQKWP